MIHARAAAACSAFILRWCALLPMLLALPAMAQVPLRLVLGTATAGGGFEVYGAALVRTVAEIDPLLQIEPRRTAGSVENIALLASGALDIALLQGEAAHEVFSAPGASQLSIVAAMYPAAGMFAVLADSPFQSIDDLRGHAIFFGARSSGLVKLARYVLDGVGFDIDRDFFPIVLDRAGDGLALLRDGKVAAIWGGGAGWPVFQAAMSLPGGARFIAPDRAQIARILARHPFLQPQTLAAGSYPGQLAAIESVGSWSFIVVRTALADESVYRLCRALQRGQTRFAELLPQAGETTVQNTAAAVTRRDLLHPGARRCLEEAGVLR